MTPKAGSTTARNFSRCFWVPTVIPDSVPQASGKMLQYVLETMPYTHTYDTQDTTNLDTFGRGSSYLSTWSLASCILSASRLHHDTGTSQVGMCVTCALSHSYFLFNPFCFTLLHCWVWAFSTHIPASTASSYLSVPDNDWADSKIKPPTCSITNCERESICREALCHLVDWKEEVGSEAGEEKGGTSINKEHGGGWGGATKLVTKQKLQVLSLFQE